VASGSREACRGRQLVDDRRAAPREDLTSRLVADLVPGDEPLTCEQRDSVTLVLVTVILAGHPTTCGLTGSALRILFTHHQQWELLCQRPELNRGWWRKSQGVVGSCR
jgi:cytochrome P450